VHDACLHHGLFPDGIHRVGEALQPVADHHQDVAGAAVLDLRQDAEPELGALAVAVLPGPQAQDVPFPVRGDPQGQVERPVGDLALADLHLDRVDEHDRVNRVERPGLPLRHPVHDPVGDRRDGLLRYFRAIDFLQVRGNLPVSEPLGCWRGWGPCVCLRGRGSRRGGSCLRGGVLWPSRRPRGRRRTQLHPAKTPC
jgi:hypothetical protein